MARRAKPARNAEICEQAGKQLQCRGSQNLGVLVPRGDLTHPAEPAGAGGRMGIEHRLHAVARPEVGIADDARAQAQIFACIPGSNMCHIVGLADRLNLGWSACAIMRPAFDEDRCNNPVTGFCIGQEVVSQIAPAGAVP